MDANSFALEFSEATMTFPPDLVTKSKMALASVWSMGFSGPTITSMLRCGSLQSLTNIGVDTVLATS